MREIGEAARVVMLGGAGGMGRAALNVVAGLRSVGEVVVADFDFQQVERVVGSTETSGRKTVTPAHVDVTDRRELEALLRTADVVLNTTGPFYRLGVGVLESSIESGCHYFDICDDWEPTLDMLALDSAAVDRGVLAVVGLGASPGISNLFAALSASDLDTIEDIYTAWPIDVQIGKRSALNEELGMPGDAPSAAALHWMQQISGKIEVIERGERVSRAPMEPVRLDYPGLGSGVAYSVGHPEPITLSTSLGATGRSLNLMVMSSGMAAFLDGLRTDIDRGSLDLEEAAAMLYSVPKTRLARAAVKAGATAGAGDLPGFFALVTGTRDGGPISVGVRALTEPSTMAEITGVPLALGLKQLLDGHLNAVGVHPPESVIDAEALLGDLGPYCVPEATEVAEMIERTETAGKLDQESGGRSA